MVRSLRFALLFALIASAAHAEIVEVPALNAATGIPAWNTEVVKNTKARIEAKTYTKSGYRECAAVNEIKGAYLCANATLKSMALGLARASAYIEGIGAEVTRGEKVPAGTLLLHSSRPLQLYGMFIGGYDLKGPDLMKFYNAAQEACHTSKNDAEVCLTSSEKEIFEQFIIPHSAKDPKFVVITYALSNPGGMGAMDYREVVSHEILHAQYFLQDNYRQVADEFWANDMTEAEREGARIELGQYYEKSDEFLMKNEFQAYVLMHGADSSLLSAQAMKFRARLQKKMSDRGVKPLQVE